MSGVYGWLGSQEAPPAQILDRMQDVATRFDHARTSRSGGENFGLGAAGLGATCLLCEHRGVHFALVGHVLWDGEARSAPDQRLAHQFIDACQSSPEAALRRLGGDFVLALIEPNRGRALVAIDRTGVRNLVLQFRHDTLIFGPSSDVVNAHPSSKATIDPQSLYNYVYFHMVPGPRTVYREHERLLPGTYALFEGGRLSVKSYWEMRFEENRSASMPVLKEEFVRSLKRGVADYASGTSCGSFLSGGTDSSTVSGLLGRTNNAPAKTYSIGFEAQGYDEMEYARLAARHFQTEHHEYYVTPEDVLRTAPLVAQIYDQPFGNASAVPAYHCATLAARDGVKRMLAGDGGDELYGGNARYAKQYKFSWYDRLPAFVRRSIVEPLARAYPAEKGPTLLRKACSYVAQASVPLPSRYDAYNLLERLGPEVVFTADFLSTVDREVPHRLVADIYRGAHAGHWLNRLLAVDLKFTLADNDLPKVTRMCELAQVDVAFPLLHDSVVEFSAVLAPKMKLRGTRLRYFFKEALRGFLPDEIIEKQKHGFGLPVGPWLASHAPLRDFAGTTLESLKQRGIFRREFIDELLSTYLPRHPGYYGTLVWVLMMLELWFQKHTGGQAGHSAGKALVHGQSHEHGSAPHAVDRAG